jgi:hypothetical protein
MGMKIRSFFPSDRTGFLAGLAVAALLAGTPALKAQDTTTAPPAEQTTQTTAPPAQAEVTLSNKPAQKKKHTHIAKAERIQETTH